MRHEVSQLLYTAKQQQGRETVVAELNRQAADLDNLYQEWGRANEQVEDIIGKLKALHVPLPSGVGEFGVIPLILPAIIVAAIAAVLVTITAVLGKYEIQRQLLKAVKDKLLTPEQARDLGKQGDPGIFGDLKTVLTMGAVVMGLVMLKPVIASLMEKRT